MEVIVTVRQWVLAVGVIAVATIGAVPLDALRRAVWRILI